MAEDIHLNDSVRSDIGALPRPNPSLVANPSLMAKRSLIADRPLLSPTSIVVDVC